MSVFNAAEANDLSREAWEANAEVWDARMGDEGNDFVNILVWPGTKRLLGVRPGRRVLDIACGNGLYARRLAALGAEVTAFDFSASLIARAREWPSPEVGRVEYRVLDATDRAGLLALGEGAYDAALCAMALFDMADIGPLLETLPRLLAPGGRFVFSIMHPCFNGSHAAHQAEERGEGGRFATRYSIRLESYLTPRTDMGVALRNQPRPQPYFHRPLHEILERYFRAGFVMDAVEEPAFPPGHPHGSGPLSWGGNFSEFPPVFIARMVRP